MRPDPLILAFDTSAAHCAAALVSGDTVLADQREEMLKGQAERLIPLLDEILKSAGHNWAALDCIAVCTGPGNFTGTRISVSTARGLGLALPAKLLGISRLEAQAFGITGPAISVVPATRGNLYVQSFEDGCALDEPSLLQADTPLRPSQSSGTLTGNEASLDLLSNAVPDWRRLLADPGALPVAQVAAQCDLTADHPRPAPLYLKAADAAPSADQPPRILDDA